MPDTRKARPFVRVEDAAAQLGISRSSAYEAANAWLRTEGGEGLPCIRIGRRILVPQAAIDRWAAIGTTVEPDDLDRAITG